MQAAEEEREELVVGQRVCVVGFGTANVVHTHRERVVRVTKTQTVTAEVKEDGATGHESRYRKSDGRMVGSFAYGGRAVSGKCQRPKPKPNNDERTA